MVRPIDARPLTAKQFIAHAFLELFSRFTSRKLWMVLFACSVPWAGLERGVNHLYALNPQQAAVYGGMFLCVMGAITAIVCRYMGIENVSVSTSTLVSGAISSASQNLFEKRDEHIVSEHTEHVIDETARNENLRANRDDPTSEA